MPKKRKFANNAWGTLASSITNTDTTITLTAGHGARFPTLGTNEVFLATLIDSSNNLEIIEVTARSTDTLTVVRGQEGTTARAYGAGDRIELRVTRGVMESVAQKDEDPVFTSHVSLSGTQVREDKGADIVAAATTDLGTATGNYVTITHASGTLAITSLGGASLPAGTEIETRFSISGGTLSLTHNATNLILPGGSNITLANGDVLRWRKEHDSNAEWRLVSAHVPGYIRNPVGASQTLTFGATTNWDASLGQVATLTLSGNTTLAAPTALKAGGHYTLRVVQDATGGRTITWDAAYKGVRGAAMPQPAPSANTTTVYHFVSDGTSLFLVSLSDDIPAPYVPPPDSYSPASVASALKAVTSSLSQVTITADFLVLRNPTTGQTRLFSSVNVTANITLSGAGGLDTGTEAASTWYYVYVIAKDDGTLSALLSTSATAPTMPSGYTMRALVSAVRNDGSSNFLNYYQHGALVYLTPRQQVVTGGAANFETSVSVASFVPAIAQRILVDVEVKVPSNTSASTNTYCDLRYVSGISGFFTTAGRTSNGATSDSETWNAKEDWIPHVTSQTIYYLLATNDGGITVAIYIHGFSLPIGGE